MHGSMLILIVLALRCAQQPPNAANILSREDICGHASDLMMLNLEKKNLRVSEEHPFLANMQARAVTRICKLYPIEAAFILSPLSSEMSFELLERDALLKDGEQIKGVGIGYLLEISDTIHEGKSERRLKIEPSVPEFIGDLGFPTKYVSRKVVVDMPDSELARAVISKALVIGDPMGNIRISTTIVSYKLDSAAANGGVKWHIFE